MPEPDTFSLADSNRCINRRDFIKGVTHTATVGALSLGVGCRTKAPIATSQTRQANCLFVYADQMREMAASCSGNPNLQTPNMDRLAAEGVRFSRRYTSSPLCSPARSSLMTGLFPHNTGVSNNDIHLRDDVRCIAEKPYQESLDRGQ